MFNIESITGNKRQCLSLAAMAGNSMIPQAMLFTGIDGIGKTHTARWFLRSLFCTGTTRPCGTCHACIQISKETFPDLIEIGPNEKGSIPIGDPAKKEAGSIRWLIDRLSKKSVYGKTGVIIRNMESLSIEGQNALLKTIEEPGDGIHIIMTVANRSSILKTILSRCRMIVFNPLSDEELSSILSKKHGGSDILNTIIPIAGGSVKLAEILLDKDHYDLILELCTSISSALKHQSTFNYDLNPLLKKTGTEPVIAILLNIYRLMLLDSVHHTRNRALPDDIFLQDTILIKKIIKILLALKKGLANNLNIKIAFKGMLYSRSDIIETVGADIASILNT